MARPKGPKNRQKPEIQEEKPVIKIVAPEIVVEDDPMLPKKGLFRVDEAADYLSLSASTIRTLISHGRLAIEKYRVHEDQERGIPRIPRESLLRFRFESRYDPMA